MKGLIFTARGSFARFRRPYTTTSALTYTLIHPIAIKGLIGSMLGIEYKELYSYTNELKIGIQVLNSLNKDTQSFNLIAQSGNNGARNFQSTVEFLRDVRYRIFVLGNNDKLIRIKNVIESRSFGFTPYLGSSEHIAYIEYEGLEEVSQLKTDICHTVVPKDHIIINDNFEFNLYIDKIPTKNNDNREYIQYQSVGYTVNNKNLCVKEDTNLYQVGNYHVYFF